MPIRRTGPKPPPPPAPTSATGSASAQRHIAESKAPVDGLMSPTLGMGTLERAPAVDAWSVRALDLEQRAVRTTDAAEKKALTEQALAAWMAAAQHDVALVSNATHGPQRNAMRAAGRLADLAATAGDTVAQSLAAGVRDLLRGDLAGAERSFGDVVTRGTASQRRSARNALHGIADARAAVALDDLAQSLVAARGDVDPRASLAKLAPRVREAIHAHPRQALAFASLWLQVQAESGALAAADVAGVLDVIKAAGHAQSQARVPSVAQKALLLAHVHRLTANERKAAAAYQRVLAMASATASEIESAHVSLARLGVASGDPARALAALAELREEKHGAVAHGLVALAESHVLATIDRSAAVAVLDHAIAGLGVRTKAAAPRQRAAHARMKPARGDREALLAALEAQKRAILRKQAPPHTAAAALDLLGALDLAQKASVPLEKLLEEQAAFGGGGGVDGDVQALVALTSARLRFLDPIALSGGTDHRSLEGLLLHVVTGQRGDAARATAKPAAATLGLSIAAGAAPRFIDEQRGADVVPAGEPARGARLAALVAEVHAALGAGPTAGCASLEEGRRALLALGWQAHPGTLSLTKDGARVSFDPFSIAQTASFHARVETVDAVAAREVHVGKLVFQDHEWKIFEAGFEEAMERYQRVLHTPQGERFVAKDIEDVRTLLSLGRPVDEIPARREQLEELAELAAACKAKIRALMAEGKAPKGVMIFVEGIDAASKTTNGMNLKRLFEELGMPGDWLSLKAPSAEERQRPWLERYQSVAPVGGGVFLADRTFLGDYAYNPTATPERMQEMAGDVRRWQRDLEDGGVLVVKLLFDPRLADGADRPPDDVLWRPMVTFGKREARALIARDMLERTGGGLSDGDRASLEAACLGPGYNDLKSFHEGGDAMERFRAFADATDDAGVVGGTWERIGTKERHDGRTHAYRALLHLLDAWGAAH